VSARLSIVLFLLFSMLGKSAVGCSATSTSPATQRPEALLADSRFCSNDPNSNVIAFPAAILQVPYFHPDIPSYLNFGATGWTVGHEVSHSFDNNGRDYGPDGRFGDSWWTNQTDAEFTRRSQCFIDQYGNYSVEGLDGKPLHLDGRQTLGENIADAGGLDTAFLAWDQHRKDFPEQDTDLPGLEKWTHEQLFFIGFANSWCSVQKKEALINQVFGDVHAPAMFRIKGSLENSLYFKQHFNCPTKQPKCKIW
jgi:endothelin-converting enzyme